MPWEVVEGLLHEDVAGLQVPRPLRQAGVVVVTLEHHGVQAGGSLQEGSGLDNTRSTKTSLLGQWHIALLVSQLWQNRLQKRGSDRESQVPFIRGKR